MGTHFTTLRPKDFKHKDVDGHGDNWPIGYEDVKPYYDKVDKLIGVFGTNEGLPNNPDGFFFHHQNLGYMNCFISMALRNLVFPLFPVECLC